jgi:hypothetical protein
MGGQSAVLGSQPANGVPLINTNFFAANSSFVSGLILHASLYE